MMGLVTEYVVEAVVDPCPHKTASGAIPPCQNPWLFITMGREVSVRLKLVYTDEVGLVQSVRVAQVARYVDEVAQCNE